MGPKATLVQGAKLPLNVGTKFNSKKELLDWIEIAKLAETANDMWAWMSTIKFGYLYNGEIYDY